MEVGADVRAFLAACPAGKPRLDVRQPNIVFPWVAADRHRIAASVIRAIDDEIANAGCAHFGECDLRTGSLGHPRDRPYCAWSEAPTAWGFRLVARYGARGAAKPR